MNTESTPRSRAMAADEIWKWTVGAGILVVALFPLSIPILVLTAVALLPLLVPVLALGLLAVAVVVPIRLARAVGSRARRLRLRKQVPVGAPVE